MDHEKKIYLTILIVISDILVLWSPFILAQIIDFDKQAWYAFPFILTSLCIFILAGVVTEKGVKKVWKEGDW